MKFLVHGKFSPVFAGLALFGVLSGIANAEVPRLDAMHVEHVETATFSLG